MSEIAMIGDRDSILGFKALGVAIFPVNTKDESTEALQEVIRQEFKVAFITEQVAPSPEEIARIIGDRTFPVVTMVPSNRGSTGLAMQRLQMLVRRAAGADIL
jgi:V/A-type H+-transporting ATPase subunit F